MVVPSTSNNEPLCIYTSCLHALPSFLVQLCVLLCILCCSFMVSIKNLGLDVPLSGWGYGLAPFQLDIWTAPFPIGDMDWTLSFVPLMCTQREFRVLPVSSLFVQ